MPIIKDWIFIHIPRTGGSYIESLFNIQWQPGSGNENDEYNKKTLFGIYRQNSLLFTLQHLTTFELCKYFQEYKEYKKFTIVRNPYHRIVSLWIHHKKQFEKYSFVEFLYLLYKKKIFEYNHSGRVYGDYIDTIKYHFIPQHFYTHDEGKKQLVDKILFYETADTENFIRNEFNIKKILFSEQNNSGFYEEFLDKVAIRLINHIYAEDFNLFNYSLK